MVRDEALQLAIMSSPKMGSAESAQMPLKSIEASKPGLTMLSDGKDTFARDQF